MEFIGTGQKKSKPVRELYLLDQELDPVGWGFRLILLILFTIMGIRFIAQPLSPELMSSFWHTVNLPFHEAGHVIFSFMPPLVVSFMGTGMQLLMPLICGGVLMMKTRDPFGCSIALWWFGQNFLDIAPYIDDARRGTLPLLGGNIGQTSPYGFHDWEFILGETGLILKDHAIANFSFGLGKCIIALSLIYGATILYRSFSRRKW